MGSILPFLGMLYNHMMKPYLPAGFENKLDRYFDGRLRIRWSHRKSQWHLEYKISRQKTPQFYMGEYEDDNVVRARDGFAFIMAIQPGDRMPCPKCRMELKVPVNKTAEVTCDYCRVMGRDGRTAAAYYDLHGEQLFDHLSKLDPYRGWRDGMEKLADAHNARLLAAKERDTLNKMEAITKENFRNLVGIQSVGYTKNKI